MVAVEKRKLSSGSRPARAFTLVELLIALVLLSVGIYAMVRIFPGGYAAIEMTRQRTTASLLAEAELTRWRLQPEALPDAIIATNYAGAVIPATLTNSVDAVDDLSSLRELLVHGEVASRIPDTTSYELLPMPAELLGRLDQTARPLIYSPTDLTPSQFDAALALLPPTPADQTRRPATLHPCWQPNSLYLPRTVIGEQIDIRRLGTSAGVPFYQLSHAPLDVLRYEGVDDPGTPNIDERTEPENTCYADIYDARTWRYVALGSALGEREFTYDPTSLQLAFGPAAAPPYARSFKVDYTDPTARQRVYGYTVSAAAGSSVGVELLPAGTAPSGIQVHERMVSLTQAERQAYTALTWPRNAYYVDAETWVTGKIEFSPLLQLSPLPGDVAVAKVDYRVRDWQILVFDVEVPANGIVQLPVRGIKGPTYINPPRQDKPQEVARGVRKVWDTDAGAWQPVDSRDRGQWAYVVAVDRQSGEILSDHEGITWPIVPQERLTRLRVNYRDGLLHFNYGQWEVPDSFNPALEGNSMAGSQWVHSRSGRTYRVFCRAEADWGVQLSLASRLYARSSSGLPGGAAVGGTSQEAPMTYAWRPEINPRQIILPLSEAGQVVAVDYYRADNGAYVSGEVHSVGGPDVLTLGEWVCQLSDELVHVPNAWGPVTVRGLSVRARATWVTPGRQPTLQDLIAGVKDPTRGPLSSLRERWHQVVLTTYLTRVPL